MPKSKKILKNFTFKITRAPGELARTGEAIKRSFFGRLLCFARLFLSARQYSVRQPKKGQTATTLPIPRLHTLTSCLRRG